MTAATSVGVPRRAIGMQLVSSATASADTAESKSLAHAKDVHTDLRDADGALLLGSLSGEGPHRDDAIGTYALVAA